MCGISVVQGETVYTLRTNIYYENSSWSDSRWQNPCMLADPRPSRGAVCGVVKTGVEVCAATPWDDHCCGIDWGYYHWLWLIWEEHTLWQKCRLMGKVKECQVLATFYIHLPSSSVTTTSPLIKLWVMNENTVVRLIECLSSGSLMRSSLILIFTQFRDSHKSWNELHSLSH